MDRDKLVRIAYDEDRDGYYVYLSNDGGSNWNLSVGCKCVRCKSDSVVAEPMYVHITLITELRKAIRCGYRMVL